MSDEEHGIIRGPNGHFLPGTGKATQFTSETARAAAHKRHDDAEEAVREALVRRFQEAGVGEANTPTEVWGDIVGEIAVGAHANAMERPHDAARAAAFVGRAAAVLRPAEAASQRVPDAGAVLVLSEAATEYIASVLLQVGAGARAEIVEVREAAS